MIRILTLVLIWLKSSWPFRGNRLANNLSGPDHWAQLLARQKNLWWNEFSLGDESEPSQPSWVRATETSRSRGRLEQKSLSPSHPPQISPIAGSVKSAKSGEPRQQAASAKTYQVAVPAIENPSRAA